MLPLILSLGAHHGELLPTVPIVAAQGSPRIALDPGGIADLSKTVGAQLAYKVNLTDAPSINSFDVVLTYDTKVLNATTADDAGNVLELTGKPLSPLADCINGLAGEAGGGCFPSAGDGPGVVHIGKTILGGKTGNPTTGLLYTVHFAVIAKGFTQVHVKSYILGTGETDANGKALSVLAPTYDGFFSNIDCPKGSHVACEPPTTIFDWSPSRILIGDVVVFNASLSHGPNKNTNLTRFFWEWNDLYSTGSTASSTEFCKFVDSKLPNGTTVKVPGPSCTNGEVSLPLNTTAEHLFKNPCRCLVSLTVSDTDGISWSTTSIVVVIRSIVDLEAQDIQPDKANLVTPGLMITIKAIVKNVGTVALNGTIEIILEAGQGKNKTLGNPFSFVNLKPQSDSETSATWDTGGYSPKVYRIDAVVPFVYVNSTLHENFTDNNVKSTWIQLIDPFSAGLSLDLLSSSGLGIAVLVVGGFALSWARRRRPPTETL